MGLYPDEKMQAYDDQIKYENSLMQPLREQTGSPGMVSEGMGSAMPILPVGAEYQSTKVLPRVYEAGKVGAKAAFTQPTMSDNPYQEKAQQVGLGAAMGPIAQEGMIALSKPILGVLNRTVEFFQRMKPGKVLIDASGEATAEFKIILEEQGIKWGELANDAKDYLRKQSQGSIEIPKNLTPQQRLAQAEYEALKMPSTKGQLLRDADQMNLENTLSGTPYGRELGNVYDSQNKRMVENLSELQEPLGYKNPKQYDVGENVGQTIKGHLGNVQGNVITPAYDKITAQYGEELFAPSGLQSLIDELFSESAEGNIKKLKWIRGMLNTSRKKNMSPQMLKALEASEGGAGIINFKAQPITVKQADNVRKRLAEFAESSPDLTEQKFYKEMVELLDQDVTAKFGSDVYAPARNLAKTEKLDFLDSRTVDKAFKSTQGHEQWFENSLVNRNIQVDEVKKFWSLLGRAGTKGVKTKKQMQSLTLQWLMDQSTKNTGLTRLEDPKFSVPAFKKALDRLGFSEAGRGNTKLETIFSDNPEALSMLSTMLRVGERNIPLPMARAGSDTFQKSINALDKLSMVPKLGVAANWAKKLMVDAKAGSQAKAATESLPGFTMSSINNDATQAGRLTRQLAGNKFIVNSPTSLMSALMGEQQRREPSGRLGKDLQRRMGR
jgi:hypothetical protein